MGRPSQARLKKPEGDPMPAQASRLCTGHRLLPSSLHPSQSACSVTGKVACSARLTGNTGGKRADGGLRPSTFLFGPWLQALPQVMKQTSVLEGRRAKEVSV